MAAKYSGLQVAGGRFGMDAHGRRPLQSPGCRRPDGATGSGSEIKAPVAQLDRVTASEAVGRGFESRRARHFPQGLYRIHGLQIMAGT